MRGIYSWLPRSISRQIASAIVLVEDWKLFEARPLVKLLYLVEFITTVLNSIPDDVCDPGSRIHGVEIQTDAETMDLLTPETSELTRINKNPVQICRVYLTRYTLVSLSISITFSTLRNRIVSP